MKQERLIHLSADDESVSYGPDGRSGRDIVIKRSQSFEQDRKTLEMIQHPETTVVSVMEAQPDARLQGALNTLMSAWNKIPKGNLYFLTGATPQILRDEFIDRAYESFSRHRLLPTAVDREALDILYDDVCDSTYLTMDIFRQDQPLSFLMIHYPPASAHVPFLHDWHDDVRNTTEGKITFNRSLNMNGMRFQFKQQAEEGVVSGVAMPTGYTVFEVGRHNVHSAPPVSPTHGRVMYTMTGYPAL